MTAYELFARAKRRRYHPCTFTVSSLKRWLDKRVEQGWLVKVKGRYYLTDAGYEIAAELDRLV